MDSHEKYLELCAASTAGELSCEEERTLKEHLAVCGSCRQAKHKFEMTVQKIVPALADDLASPTKRSDAPWSVEKAEAAFFERLQAEQNSSLLADNALSGVETEPTVRRRAYRPSEIPWAGLWMPFAACVLLAIALGIVAYRGGFKRGTHTALEKTLPAQLSAGSVEEQISDFGHERAELLAKLAVDDKVMAELKRDMVAQGNELGRLRTLNSAAVASTKGGQQFSGSSSTEISRLSADLIATQSNIQELQAKTEALSQQREEAAKRAETLEAKVSELTQLARDREQALDQQQAQVAKQQEMLDHDRDIRELMGARDLYIAEVHDVGGTGEMDKTYGRVFYTKGKSLIFYAYDLDQEAGLKNASTFQAWGRRGVDKQQAFSLGIFYEDNASKKRWVLKFDDAKALANIDAVFVTVEPHGGSHHPSGKQLLFAYLRVNPNHP